MLSRRYKIGDNRQQSSVLPLSLDEYVSGTNVVRTIEAYVKSLDMADLSFSNTETSNERGDGQPAYPPSMLLKSYL